MKNRLTLVYVFVLLGFHCTTFSQSSNLNEHPINDKQEVEIRNTDTIPDFATKINKLKIFGTVYENDGVTPAKDVILYIEQADVNGDFDLRGVKDNKYVHHRAWVKTDANGQYTLYTFIPGNDRRYNQLQQLFPSIKEPSKPVYDIQSFLFDDDPLLTKLCRKRMHKKGDPSRILKPKKEGNLNVVQKDITLNSQIVVLN